MNDYLPELTRRLACCIVFFLDLAWPRSFIASATLRYVAYPATDRHEAANSTRTCKSYPRVTLQLTDNWFPQGVHNLCTENHVIPDPLLTDLGHEQCRKLKEAFPSHANVDLVTASPLRRTIYTALESFEPAFKAHPDMQLIALPDIQETSDVPCDTGSDPQVLREEFAGKNVDLGLVHEGWNNKVRWQS